MPGLQSTPNRQLNAFVERPLSGIAFSESKFRNLCITDGQAVAANGS